MSAQVIPLGCICGPDGCDDDGNPVDRPPFPCPVCAPMDCYQPCPNQVDETDKTS